MPADAPLTCRFPAKARAYRTPRATGKKIGFESHNDLGVLNMVQRIERFSERQAGTLRHGVSGERLVLVPDGEGKLCEERIELLPRGR